MADSIPVVCLLSEDEQPLHEEDFLRELMPSVEEIKELADGFKIRFSGEATWVNKLIEFIHFERVCCPFFQFELVFEPQQGPVWLTLSGPPGTKDFLSPLLKPS